MGIFAYMLLGHLAGDYLFQTRWMALCKASEWPALLIHCLVYTACIAISLSIGSGRVEAGAVFLIFLSHVILDRRNFVAWWARRVMGVAGGRDGWLITMADQSFHLLILGVVGHIWYS